MPQIVMCKDCENGHWEDKPCPTCAPRLMRDEIASLRAALTICANHADDMPRVVKTAVEALAAKETSE